MACILNPRRSWSMDRDEEGHRTYKITHQVTAAIADGPQRVMCTPGLPMIGSVWMFGNDVDLWAMCHPQLRITPRLTKEPNRLWDVEQTFSTKPLSRCQDTEIEDPLLEPQKVSGNFVRYMSKVEKDYNGDWIKNSSHEKLRDIDEEFDDNRPTVRIEQNVSLLELDVFSEMVNTVNDNTLWGLEKRKIKLSNVSWERKLFGICNYYYIRTFEFDVDFNTFDREILDMGRKVLNGHWNKAGEWVLDPLADYGGAENPDPTKPSHFIQATDKEGNLTELTLDGHGKPWDGVVVDNPDDPMPGKTDIEYYPESNFLLLGIPTEF